MCDLMKRWKRWICFLILLMMIVLGGCVGETPLPKSYDARGSGRTAPVKNQGNQGTCWAHASLLALENRILPGETLDFSEKHMIQNPYFPQGSSQGNYIMAMAYLLSWQGPVLERGNDIQAKAAKHVQEIQILPERDHDAVKRAVYENGGVQSSLYASVDERGERSEHYNPDTGAYCCLEDAVPNHDVVIVGWDDSYPKENFLPDVPGDGAYLCQNSWGTQFGEDGFFYVSYYDGNLTKTNIVYTSVESDTNYDVIYQSDLCGWNGQIGYGSDTAWAMNVYETGEAGEQLEAVGFYATDRGTQYEVYIYTDIPEKPGSSDWEEGSAGRMPLAKGRLDYAGYYTVGLDRPVELEAGMRFGVMIRLITPGAVHPIAIEYDAGDGQSVVDLNDGEGYISPDGLVWEHVESAQRCNLCLKAYTTRQHGAKETGETEALKRSG